MRRGLLFPGDPGVGAASPRASTRSCRASASPGIRPATGAGRSARATASSTISSRTAPARRRRWPSARFPWAQFIQFSGAGLNFQNPYQGRPAIPAPTRSCGRRPCSRSISTRSRRRAELERRRAALALRQLPRRGPLRRRRRAATLPRNVEANPAVYGPGATAQNADRRRIYANCPADGGACDFSTIAMLRTSPIVDSRRPVQPVAPLRRAVGFNVSYWYSKSIDHLSAMNLSGAAAKPLAGENDLAQNPFDLEAEWGRRSSTRGIASSPAPAGCRRAVGCRWRVRAVRRTGS